MVNLIVAIGVDNIIGMDNDLPWYYPEDLKYFKKVTKGKISCNRGLYRI